MRQIIREITSRDLNELCTHCIQLYRYYFYIWFILQQNLLEQPESR